MTRETDRRRRPWLLPVVVLLLAGCTTADEAARPGGRSGRQGEPAPPAGAFAATVERVVDGDTLIARVRGHRLRVRLIGVDAPESVKPGAPVECWGRKSAELLGRLLPAGGDVRATYQPGGRRDRYDRELWDVWLPDGRFLQAVLVRRGAAHAVAYRPQVAHADVLAGLEATARDAGRGLHGACPP